MNTLGERLKTLIKELNITAEKFAIKIGEDKGSMSKWTNGRNIPGSDVLSKIIENFQNVNSFWLLTGKGDMFISNNYKVPVTNQTIEEPLSDLYMDANEIKDLKQMVVDLMATVRDQASTLKGFAAAEVDNAKARLNLTETISSQERTIENLSQSGTELKKAVGDTSR